MKGPKSAAGGAFCERIRASVSEKSVASAAWNGVLSRPDLGTSLGTESF
jgi:hypothetical protein